MQGTLTFARPADVVPDHERPGLLRAQRTEDDAGAVRACSFNDLSSPTTPEPGLLEAGFATVDLAGNDTLQRTLAEIAAIDQLNDELAATIRSSIDGIRLSCLDGTTLQVDYVVDDGLFHRRSGPNGHNVNPGGIIGLNGHGGAAVVHGDQDVFGTPLRQLMHGTAPDMFRHVTPDGRNDESSLCMLNLWIPIQAPVQPLALMDRRTLDAARHQLRYGLPVDDFLERDADASVNDIWSFLHDDAQEWFLRTDMTSAHGYLFDTLGTPHGAAVLDGEVALEELFVTLSRAWAALDDGDDGPYRALADAAPSERPPDHASPTILAAWQRMEDLRIDARKLEPAHWSIAARAATDAVIRRSIEMRLIASVVDE